MANKLDVYQIVLNKRAGTFRDVICKINKITEINPDNSKVFMSLYNYLLKLIGSDVCCFETKKMGLSILKEKKQRLNTAIKSHSNSNIIEGFIDGGSYDTIRNLTKIGDISRLQKINKNDIVMDRYYFYLYLPIESKIGILMVQTKDNSSIRRVIKPFIEKLFAIDSKKSCKVQCYYPQWLKEEFLKGAHLTNISFEKENVSQVISNSELATEEEKYDVKIIITPVNAKTSVPNALNFINRIGSFFALKCGDTHCYELSSFKNKKGTLKNDDKNRSYSFVMDNEDNIHPVIEIDDYLEPDENGNFDRNQLKGLCDSILNKIKPEIYATEHS